MANALFLPAKEGFLDGSINWDDATIKVSAIRGYNFNSAHRFMSQVLGAGGTQVATETLLSKTVTNGAADAADVTFPTVQSGNPITSLVIYQASGPAGGADVVASQQRLIAFLDSAANLPITPNGGNIDVVFDAGENRIFRL